MIDEKLHDSEIKQIEMHGLRYSTTIKDLKVKLFETCKLRPFKTTIYKNEQSLIRKHCTLLYYDISQGIQFETIEVQIKNDDNKNKMKRSNMKYNNSTR